MKIDFNNGKKLVILSIWIDNCVSLLVRVFLNKLKSKGDKTKYHIVITIILLATIYKPSENGELLLFERYNAIIIKIKSTAKKNRLLFFPFVVFKTDG
jgi:hypothetical protein